MWWSPHRSNEVVCGSWYTGRRVTVRRAMVCGAAWQHDDEHGVTGNLWAFSPKLTWNNSYWHKSFHWWINHQSNTHRAALDVAFRNVWSTRRHAQHTERLLVWCAAFALGTKCYCSSDWVNRNIRKSRICQCFQYYSRSLIKLDGYKNMCTVINSMNLMPKNTARKQFPILWMRFQILASVFYWTLPGIFTMYMKFHR